MKRQGTDACSCIERFKFDLYRPNDEALVIQNIKDSQSSLKALEESLPHLFATCRKLREIKIKRHGRRVK
jgi:hypothetical protein